MQVAFLELITSLYQAVASQQKVVDEKEKSVEFFQEANLFLDVEQLAGATMHQEIRQLTSARDILDDLNARLAWAIQTWGQPNIRDEASEQFRLAQSPDITKSELSAEEQRLATLTHKSAPSLRDPAVGAQARYEQQWRQRMAAPTIHNPSDTLDLSKSTPWWMQEHTHYGLCQPVEQGQLEHSARAAQLNRTPYTTQPQLFPQQESSAQHVRFLSSALFQPPAPGVHLSHSRKARSCTLGILLDGDCDFDFWQKNLRPGNIWTDAPRDRISEDGNLSPRTVPLDLPGDCQPGFGSEAVAGALHFGQDEQVGGIHPSFYFYGA